VNMGLWKIRAHTNTRPESECCGASFLLDTFIDPFTENNMKLKPQHIQPVIMAGIMAFLMTGFITWLNLGLPSNFIALWARAFIIAWPLAAMAAYIAIPIAQKATRKILTALYGTA